VTQRRNFRRKNIRLPLELYSQGHVLSVTSVTSGRHPAFRDTHWPTVCLRELREAADLRAMSIYAYCLMPDHLHLLLRSNAGHSVINFLKDFKQQTGFWYKRSTGRTLWQASYHDHFARSDEDLLAAARYIFGNPVRVGLADHAAGYPFNGSFVWERDVLVEA
jgi:putative transposase